MVSRQIHIRDFDPGHDIPELRQIDTSFASDRVYEVVGGQQDLGLSSRPVAPPRLKSFAIDFDDEVWHEAYVPVEDGAACGLIDVRFDSWNRRLSIYHFYVDLRRRRRGIGRRLMERAITSGRHHGASHLWIETSNLNHPGIEVYRHLGFSICGFDAMLYHGTLSQNEFAIYMARPMAKGADQKIESQTPRADPSRDPTPRQA